ncbi:MAG: SPFH domain-containing protein [Oscillospiraceae bacterium]
MSDTNMYAEEKKLKAANGMTMLIINTLVILLCVCGFIFGIVLAEDGNSLIGGALAVVCALLGFVICPIMYAGLKVLKPNEALVLTLFGKYSGTLVGEGYYYVNPFSVATNPTKASASEAVAVGLGQESVHNSQRNQQQKKQGDNAAGKAVSLKVMTLNNERQKVNDMLGNPIEIGVVVIWRVVNAAKAVFNVDNYMEFLSIQADSSLRNTVRLYPYDIYGEDDAEGEMSLRGSSQEVAVKLREELQKKVEDAGLEIVETRITHLAYAPEIAAAMLQRQQASAIIDARKLIVEGAVGMVQMALKQLSENDIVNLDDERRAAMVSNLLVVLCGSREAQPVINSGSLF